MSTKTGIEWTDSTWNPLRGCSRVSEGCRFCYAERVAARFSGPGMPYEGLAEMTPSGPRWTGNVRLVAEHLMDPIRWTKPRRIFVNSMSDLFHESLTFDTIALIFAVMASAKHHTFQVLTKRPEVAVAFFTWLGASARRARESVFNEDSLDWCTLHVLSARLKNAVGDKRIEMGGAWPLPNVWIGTSVENQAAADRRIPNLLSLPAAVRFLSVEPLLGPLVLPVAEKHQWPDKIVGLANKEEPDDWKYWSQRDNGIGWVIVGGESGPGARPMHPDWARSLRDQCAAAHVPYFFKQHGDWLPFAEYALRDGEDAACAVGHRIDLDGTVMARVGKHVAGRLLDGRTWDEFPEVLR